MLYLQDPEKTKNIYDKNIIKSKEKTKPMQQILVPRGTKQIYTFSGYSTGATTKDSYIPTMWQKCLQIYEDVAHCNFILIILL